MRKNSVNFRRLRLFIASSLLAIAILTNIGAVSMPHEFKEGSLLTAGAAIRLPPHYIAGFTGKDDERDADLYPAVAYDAVNQRYLAIWLTALNATSSGSGFDIFGVFLDRSGHPSGSPFRISDSNTVARNGPPAIAAGKGEFIVAWTKRGTSCQLALQRVVDSSAQPDHLLELGSGTRHSPDLSYNPVRKRYAVTFVQGEDYLPATFFGASTADCGNNAASSSNAMALEVHWNGADFEHTAPISLSSASGGAFRPKISYNEFINQYLAVWEDRRSASGQEYFFEVYGRRMDAAFNLSGNDFALAPGADYTNYDASATWTPRPTVASGKENYLVSWFSRQPINQASLWSVQSKTIPVNDTTGTPFTVAEATFAQPHPNQAPTGFLDSVYSKTAGEYLIGVTMHLETVWGYLSSANVQRVTQDGKLLKLDGSLQSQPGVGYAVDYSLEDQVGICLAVNARAIVPTDFTVLYGRHATNSHSQDYDIWGTQLRVPTPGTKSLYLPLTRR